MVEEKEGLWGKSHHWYVYVICKDYFIVKTFGMFHCPLHSLHPSPQIKQGHGPRG